MIGIGIIAIVLMLIVPLPIVLLDFLLVISITIGLLILMIVMFVNRPFDFSIFPSLLLITTVFRLALSVSSTRLILMHGSAFDGKIIRTFGEFVVGGNYVIGFIIFVILVAVQFIVITKGATRTSEVAARFTLDAMPTKYGSIDIDVANGHITEDEARVRREEIRKEADFYGAMDGASKFIQGDVKVGILITLITILGGFMVGMLIHGESFNVALRTYTLLTIGDGLVTQIPSLLITTAAGIIITRAESKDNLGDQIASQMGAQPKVMFIASGALGLAIFIPGFPKIPLIMLSVGLAALGKMLSDAKEKNEIQAKKAKEAAEHRNRRPESVLDDKPFDILAIHVGIQLIALADPNSGGVLLERIGNIRKRSYQDMGLLIPPIRICDNMNLNPEEYSIQLKGVEIGRGVLQLDKLMAMDAGDVTEKISGTEFLEPAYGMKAIWIDIDMKDIAEKHKYMVSDCATVIAVHLTELVKRHASELLGRQEVKQIVDKFKSDYPAVVEELQSEKITNGDIQKVLHNLLRERVSIKNMLTIMETMATYSKLKDDPNMLTEYVRIALARQITQDYIDKDDPNNLYVITVDSEIESMIRSAIYDDAMEGRIVALDPQSHEAIVGAMRDAYSKAVKLGYSPVFLVSPHIRSLVLTLLEREIASPAVLSYNEINSGLKVNVVASALFPDAA